MSLPEWSLPACPHIPSVLTIAGSDSSGGAGIQADIKTITACGCFAQSAIAALTAQNTLGVAQVVNIDPQALVNQIMAVFDDIAPAAVKVGMLSTADNMRATSRVLKELAQQGRGPQYVVVDPVMVATSGAALMDGDAAEALEELMGQACVITPNIPEAQVLCGMEIRTPQEMEQAAVLLAKRTRSAVLLKGGHFWGDTCNDLLMELDGSAQWFEGPRVKTENTHGTGCTLSSALASGLARGMDIPRAVRFAKDYVAGALASGLDLGRGSGPVDHMWMYRKTNEAACQ